MKNLYETLRALFFVFALILLLNLNANAQSICGVQLKPLGATPITSYTNAKSLIEPVLKAAGININQITFVAAQVGGHLACACQDAESNKISILFDPDSINALITANSNDWMVKSIFAHEAGHLKKAHFLSLECTNDKGSKQCELEADEFAGVILAKMGATLNASLTAYSGWIGDEKKYIEKNVTNYPLPSERLAAVTRGWKGVPATLDAVFYYNRGNELFKEGNYDDAIRNYEKAIALKSDYISAYFNLGRANLRKGNFNTAITNYDKVIKLKYDHSAAAFYNRGLAHKELSDEKSAFEDFTTAITLNPNFANAYNERGRIYYNRTKFNEAIIDFNKAIALKSDFAEAYLHLGDVLESNGKYVDAITSYKRAITLQPNNPIAYNNLGFAYYKNLSYELAIASFKTAIEQEPNDAGYYNNRANAYKDNGNYDKAIADYEKALQINPKYRTVKDNLKALRNRLRRL